MSGRARKDWSGWLPEMPGTEDVPPAADPPEPRLSRAVVGALVGAALFAAGVLGFIAVSGDEQRPAPTPSPSTAPPPAEAPDFAAVYRRVAPAVVQVLNAGGAEGTGSGVIVDAVAGLIVTSDHVVAGNDELDVVLADGRRAVATVAGRDPARDVAVLQIRNPPEGLVAAPLGNSDQAAPGDPVAALGAPFGLRNTLTVGVISAVDRTFRSERREAPLRGLIQTDAAVNPGNSGGPLVNGLGQVIGINIAIESPIRGSVGVGFAVPINQARGSLPQLL